MHAWAQSFDEDTCRKKAALEDASQMEDNIKMVLETI
jgi:hypothetical protein